MSWGPGGMALVPGTLKQEYALWNRGTSPCNLRGSPGLRVIGTEGETLEEKAPDTTLDGQADLYGHPARVVLLLPGLGRSDELRRVGHPQGYAFVALAWASYDIRTQRACPKATSRVASAELLLPDGAGTLPLYVDWSGCGIGTYPFTE